MDYLRGRFVVNQVKISPEEVLGELVNKKRTVDFIFEINKITKK